MSLPGNLRKVVVLALADDWSSVNDLHASLLHELVEKCFLHVVTAKENVTAQLEHATPAQAILVLHAAISTPSFRLIAEKTAEYTHRGGTEVLAGQFSNTISLYDIDGFLARYMGLVLETCANSLHLANVDKQSALYKISEDPQDESVADVPGRHEVLQTHATWSKIGKGWLGYLGDVNGEKETYTVIMGMLGLL